MVNDPKSNHGEGNPEAADRFNSSEREFVNSPRGRQKIQEGPRVLPDEEADLAKAEKAGRDRAVSDDSEASTQSKG